MIRNISQILGTAGLVFAVAVCLLASVSASKAQDFTPEQRANCSGDAFRYCSAEMPSIPAITACMRKNRAQLSPACKAVFPK